MTWVEDDKHPFAGIAEKLKRSDENIGNLHTEIRTFFEKSKYPLIPHPDEKGWQEAVDYHKNLRVPMRFRVLSGEIVHHLRSCLDHVVWHFSGASYRATHENAIEFPIFSKPLSKHDTARYQRKVEGIKDPRVIDLIDQLQPHHKGNDAINDPICIVHDMDRFDKHRELTIVTACANVTFAPGTSLEAIRAVLSYRQGKLMTISELAMAQRTVKNNAKVLPQVAFAQFGNRDGHFVVPSLAELQEMVIGAVDLFAQYA